MLPRKDRGGNEQRTLFGIRHAFESGSQRYFRFSETDISAQQPVHRSGAFHIVLDLGNAAFLIGSFFIFKPCLKISLPFAVGRKSVSRSVHSFGIKPYQLVCNILDSASDTVFRL